MKKIKNQKENEKKKVIETISKHAKISEFFTSEEEVVASLEI